MTAQTEPTTRTVWQLARMAECFDPDSENSAGGQFLRHVEDATVEAHEYGWNDDSAHEIADGAPHTYTAQRWAEFTDLGAWQEDVEDLAGDERDMTQLAAIALYQIAERLAGALAYELADENGEED